MLLKYKKIAILYKGVAKHIININDVGVLVSFKCIFTIIVL